MPFMTVCHMPVTLAALLARNRSGAGRHLRGRLLRGSLSMRHTFIAALALAGVSLAAPAHAETITGAGSTWVYPLVAKWAAAYKEKTGTEVNYASIGSGGGI